MPRCEVRGCPSPVRDGAKRRVESGGRVAREVVRCPLHWPVWYWALPKLARDLVTWDETRTEVAHLRVSGDPDRTPTYTRG